MILTENKMKKILVEEYEKRIISIMLERMQIETSDGINVWLDADPLKVKHDKSGVIFSFEDIQPDQNRVRLLMNYESRVDSNQNSSSLMPEIDEDNDIYRIGKKEYDPINNKDYFCIDIKTFEKEFSRP